ncbi:hypothetical protein Ndes2526B_g02314 [Nannochloris sp. 'desiccata']|nr:putative BTB/POZ domain-containing protein KCTD16 [Chlorella desiccata (nom. nud.)]
MLLSADEKDSIQLLYAPCLFLPTADGEDVAAPVVILQNDGANIYAVLENHIHPNYLSQPDKFWKVVRNIPNPPLETWRPRVYGVQLKMLQGARLPHSPQEWANVGEAVTSLIPYLQSSSSPEALLRDLQSFVRSVEQWWGGRKREGSGGGLKRNAATVPNGLVQSAGKRLAMGDPMLPMGLPTEQLLAAAGLDASFLPPGLQPLPQTEQLAMASLPLDADFSRVFNMNNLTEMQMAAANGLANGDGKNNDSNTAAAAANPNANANASLAWLRKVVTLNVGGKTFSTTLATLTAVEGSYLWKLAHKVRSTNASEYFLDRNGEVFSCVLDYLRCQRYNEDPKSILPEDTSALKLLKREAAFYKLPGLEKTIADANAGASGAACDAVFLQTGFVKDGEILTRAHAELLKRLNVELKVKAQQGFQPKERQCGTEAQGEFRNIWTHIFFYDQQP